MGRPRMEEREALGDPRELILHSVGSDYYTFVSDKASKI